MDQAITGGDVVSIQVGYLIHGVIPTMFFERLWIAAAVIVGLESTGMGWAAYQAPGVARAPDGDETRRGPAVAGSRRDV